MPYGDPEVQRAKMRSIMRQRRAHTDPEPPEFWPLLVAGVGVLLTFALLTIWISELI